MTCKNESTTQDKIYVFSGSCLRSLRCIILYSIYLYIHILYVEMFSFFLVITLLTLHSSPCSPWVVYALIWGPRASWVKIVDLVDHWHPKSKSPRHLVECSVWSNLKHSFWSSTSTGTAAAELQDDTTASFSEKRHAEKSKKTQLWMKMVKHSNSTPSKIQAFVFINSENKLGTLHVVELFSRCRFTGTVAAATGYIRACSRTRPVNVIGVEFVLQFCFTGAASFFTFVFCLHPFCLLETLFVIVLSDLDSGQHYKLCLDMDGVSTALLPGQHSTQELRSEFCFFQYLKFKVFFPKIVFFLLKIVFFHNSHIFQACLSH